MDKNSFEAQLLHTPFDKEDAYHSLSMPVYNTAAYEFDTALRWPDPVRTLSPLPICLAILILFSKVL